jgi:hypothetical protein
LKTWYLSLITVCLIIFSGNQVHAEKIDYEKYGRIAVAVVKADYPGEQLTEYQYLGREKLNETDVQDSFKFQVKENGNTKTVQVKIKHSIKNNKLLTLTVEEVKN